MLVAPDHVVQPGAVERLWGVFAPTYSLRTELGIGADVMDLDVLGAWIDGYGGKVVGTLPLLASYLDQPCEPSPYSPVSRRFWNEVYLDVERLPEMARSPAARARLDDPGTQAEIAGGAGRSGLLIGAPPPPDECAARLTEARGGRTGPMPAAQPEAPRPKPADLLRNLLR